MADDVKGIKVYQTKDGQFGIAPAKWPLNCPKGYGLCWTCATWCDQPSACTHQVPSEKP